MMTVQPTAVSHQDHFNSLLPDLPASPLSLVCFQHLNPKKVEVRLYRINFLLETFQMLPIPLMVKAATMAHMAVCA